MCSNWKRGNRKEDMSLERRSSAPSARTLWKNIENASISGGEPTTRNDLVDICRLMIDKFPKLRKLTINTTGLTPHRAIPMLTKIVELCHERGVIFSTRVSIDGVGDMHNEVRNVRKAFEKASQTIAPCRSCRRSTASTSASRRPSSRRTSRTPTTSWPGRRRRSSTSSSTWSASPTRCSATSGLEGTLKPIGAEEERMRQFFLDRVRQDPLLDGQNYIYMHYADMIANGYHRLAPCPFQTQGIMLNPNGDLFFCENSDVVGNVTGEDPEEIYFGATRRRTGSRFATRSARAASARAR